MAEVPKSSFELAMERLKAADRDAGVSEEAPLTPAQKEEIAEARRVASARLAEREILFKDGMKKTFEPEARAVLEEEFRMDRERIEKDQDRAIEKIRRGGR
jgi:hypothetical protein